MRVKKKVGEISSVSSDASTDGGLFREFRLPDGHRIRIMNRQVFDRAVRRADAKLAGKNFETGKLSSRN